jgi:heme-degrading monooxygenase HmoA
MIARAVRYENVTQENWDIGREWFLNDYLPVALQTEGFAGAYLLHDDERMRTMSVTLWRDEQTAAASGVAVQQHLDAWEEMTGIKGAVETYAVVSAELPAGAARKSPPSDA